MWKGLFKKLFTNLSWPFNKERNARFQIITWPKYLICFGWVIKGQIPSPLFISMETAQLTPDHCQWAISIYCSWESRHYWCVVLQTHWFSDWEFEQNMSPRSPSRGHSTRSAWGELPLMSLPSACMVAFQHQPSREEVAQTVIWSLIKKAQTVTSVIFSVCVSFHASDVSNQRALFAWK